MFMGFTLAAQSHPVLMGSDKPAAPPTHRGLLLANGRRYLVPIACKKPLWGFFGTGAILPMLPKRDLGSFRFPSTDNDRLDRLVENGLISVGTPGPHQKYTVIGDCGRGATAIKIGFGFGGRTGVDKEAAALLAISQAGGGRNRYVVAPNCLWHAGSATASWVEQEMLLGMQLRRWDSAFIFSRYAAWLQSKIPRSRVDPRTPVFELADAASTLRGKISQLWSDRLAACLALLLDTVPLDLVLTRSHGDFTKWNMRRNGDQLLLFDWEYSRPNIPILYDFLHFLLIPLALRGRIRGIALRKIWATLNRYIPHRKSDLAWQILFYANHLSLIYLDANEGRDSGDRVLESMAELIDRLLVLDFTKSSL